MSERIEAEEQAALLALDALESDEQADAELRHGAFPAELVAAAAALADATEMSPPGELRAAVLGAALRRRAPGRPVDPPRPVTPREAFDRTIDDFARLLAGLGDDEWNRSAHEEHGRVRDLVAHLVGVEALCVGWLGPDRPADALVELDHVAATRPVVDALAGVAPAVLAQRWEAAARAVAAAAREGDQQRPVHFHDLVGDPDALLVIRTFELWAHGMDIALATDRPLPMLDDERMALLSSRLMASVPALVAYRGVPVANAQVRFVLTGPAGGCYDVALGENPSTRLTVVADAVQLCRVAARRLPAEKLDVDVVGDDQLATTLLSAVDAFARD